MKCKYMFMFTLKNLARKGLRCKGLNVSSVNYRGPDNELIPNQWCQNHWWSKLQPPWCLNLPQRVMTSLLLPAPSLRHLLERLASTSATSNECPARYHNATPGHSCSTENLCRSPYSSQSHLVGSAASRQMPRSPMGNAFRPKQKGWRFSDDIFEYILLTENLCIWFKFYRKWFPSNWHQVSIQKFR